MKRFLSVLLTVAMCMGLAGTSFAEDVSSESQTSESANASVTDTTDTSSANKDDDNSAYSSKDGSSAFLDDVPSVECGSAILMEAKTGTILYGKNDIEKRYPASITKLLTSLVAVENSDMDDPVKITEDCVSWLQWDESSLGVSPGEELTMEQALYAVLLKSANEVSYAVGKNVGELQGHDYDWFIDQMNDKVDELGGVNSHFANTNGLHDDDHYTCANDMALIARELFNYQELLDIMQTSSYTIKKSDTVNKDYKVSQHHRMLKKKSSYYEDYAVGGKTGRTAKAGSTLVTMADNGDLQLVCVILKGKGVQNYKDTKKLFEWAFENFKVEDISNQATLFGQGSTDDYESIYTAEETAEKYADNKDVLRKDAGYMVLPNDVDFDQLQETQEGTLDDGNLLLSYSLNGLTVGRAIAQPKQGLLDKLKNDGNTSGDSSDSGGESKDDGGIADDLIGGTVDLLSKFFSHLQNLGK